MIPISPSSKTWQVTELMGDGISLELQQSVHSVVDALPLDIQFDTLDWSLAERERVGVKAIDVAAESMRRNRLALKYPTTTKRESPNAQIRRRLNFSVIYRPATSIEGIASNFRPRLDLHVVRVATGGTYGDPGRRIGRHAAVSLRLVERGPCAQAAHFAFKLARAQKAGGRDLPLVSSSKYTIQHETDGFFEEVVSEVGESYPDIRLQKVLFDAMLAEIIIKPEEFQVVLVLNEYGDFLSDMACGLTGSIGIGASGNYSFDENHQIDVAMFDPAGGTAPDIAGRNICNPTAILLSLAMLLDHIGEGAWAKKLKSAILGAIGEGQTTADLGGGLGTQEFTAVVIERMLAESGAD